MKNKIRRRIYDNKSLGFHFVSDKILWLEQLKLLLPGNKLKTNLDFYHLLIFFFRNSDFLKLWLYSGFLL